MVGVVFMVEHAVVHKIVDILISIEARFFLITTKLEVFSRLRKVKCHLNASL